MTWPAIVPRIVPRGKLAQLLPTYRAMQPTVGHAAASRTGTAMPAGFDHTGATVELPAGSFETASTAVLTLAMHRASGLLTASGEHVTVNDTVVVGVPLGPLALAVPCRVTWASDEGDERGFGYATLPGHPEAGEESFIVSRDAAGKISFTVRAFSRPSGLSRLGAPVARAAARRTIGKYLAAMVELTA